MPQSRPSAVDRDRPRWSTNSDRSESPSHRKSASPFNPPKHSLDQQHHHPDATAHRQRESRTASGNRSDGHGHSTSWGGGAASVSDSLPKSHLNPASSSVDRGHRGADHSSQQQGSRHLRRGTSARIHRLSNGGASNSGAASNSSKLTGRTEHGLARRMHSNESMGARSEPNRSDRLNGVESDTEGRSSRRGASSTWKQNEKSTTARKAVGPLKAMTTWVRVWPTGETGLLQVDKQTLINSLGIQARDFRVMESQAARQACCILCREKCIIVNMSYIRAVITAHYVLLVPPEDDRSAVFLGRLKERIREPQAMASPAQMLLGDPVPPKQVDTLPLTQSQSAIVAAVPSQSTTQLGTVPAPALKAAPQPAAAPPPAAKPAMQPGLVPPSVSSAKSAVQPGAVIASSGLKPSSQSGVVAPVPSAKSAIQPGAASGASGLKASALSGVVPPPSSKSAIQPGAANAPKLPLQQGAPNPAGGASERQQGGPNLGPMGSLLQLAGASRQQHQHQQEQQKGKQQEQQQPPQKGNSKQQQQQEEPKGNNKKQQDQQQQQQQKGHGQVRPMEEGGLELPLELKSLEICLDELASDIDQRTHELEFSLKPAIDGLAKSVRTENLDLLRRLKTRLVSLKSITQTVCGALEELLEDDDDMFNMSLTAKEQRELDLLQRVSFAISEDEEEGYASDDSRSSDHSVKVSQVEMLLEAYFMHFDSIVDRLQDLMDNVGDTEAVVNIKLDAHQNRLLSINLVEQAFTLINYFGIGVFGFFTMNLDASYPLKSNWSGAGSSDYAEPSVGYYMAVLMPTIFGAYILFAVVIGYLIWKGTLQIM